MNWWKMETNIPSQESLRGPAVAYYRHSVQGRQEISIKIQRNQVREWAEKNGVEILQEFADYFHSELLMENRPAFNLMMVDWVQQRDDFQYVLCLDLTRWGRFSNIDCSAYYCAFCEKYGKQVIFTSGRYLRK